MKRTAATATGIQTASFSRRLAVSKSGTRAMMPPSTSMMQASMWGTYPGPMRTGVPSARWLPEIEGRHAEGDEHHPGQEVLA